MQQAKSETRIVGRDTESAVIADAISALQESRGRVLFLAGEPGIGKSTLARNAADKAREAGLSVYWGFAWEAGGAPAYWPWTQSLRSLIADRKVSAETLNSLDQVLPETAGGRGQEDLNPDQARFRLLEAVRSLLDTCANDQPLVIILEDLHAADSDSLNLLHYVARHAASMRLLIVGTYREAEAKTSPSMGPLWQTTRDATVMRLARLDADAVREYLVGIGHRPDDDEVRAVISVTSGNPLFLTELMAVLEHDDGSVEDRLPDNVQQVIRQQIQLLPDSAARILGHAAIFGRQFRITELASLEKSDVNAIDAALRPAIDIGLLHSIDDGRLRFSHALHREVLYGDMSAADRSLLHTRQAAEIRACIAAGDEDRWGELASHLAAAGDEHRREAIEAWRNAARRARQRLAFVDAATSMQHALKFFGDGPRYAPTERVALLLECAESMLLAGDIDGGRRHCSDAFDLARTLGDASLMSECALAYGSVFIVASIDKNLIGMLRESLDAVPEDDVATRARVQARLAAALQPAEDPSGPMEMARLAIGLARRTNDDHVLHEVLRSAISAIMDFALARERLPLNREFGELSAKFGDVAGLFRSNLRLMVDAAELGDRQLLIEAVDACEQIADRIALPHYRWRAASARAMLATIEGRFAAANALLGEAEGFAEIVGDLEAGITLPLQRFALLCDWDSDEVMPLDQIDLRLEKAFAGGMAAAEFFVRPLIAAYTIAEGESARQLLSNEAIIERTFAGGDRFSIIAIAQVAMLAGDDALARRCYDRLLEYTDECATPGLMGSTWCGPVRYTLGRLAHYSGDLEEARSCFEDALVTAKAMHAAPYSARILASLADVVAELGDEAAADKYRESARHLAAELSLRSQPIAPRPDSAPVPPATRKGPAIEHNGDICKIRFGDESVTLKRSKGLEMLARLLAEPGRDLHVLDLSGTTEPVDRGDAGPALDEKARSDYKARVGELQAELEEATELGDLGQIDALREELDFITRELSRAYGIGGRQRRSGGATERARVNVRRRISDAIKRIGEQLPDAGRYLENTIKTGAYCRYTPM